MLSQLRPTPRNSLSGFHFRYALQEQEEKFADSCSVLCRTQKDDLTSTYN